MIHLSGGRPSPSEDYASQSVAATFSATLYQHPVAGDPRGTNYIVIRKLRWVNYNPASVMVSASDAVFNTCHIRNEES
jgi:hypothetical protein